mmetsp:Transcript_26234/g.75259  ORF Transcript_26234/g.75259 Transcript_26234/m.75259 type:complete len:221 (+) Transcript_26234:590-1252(+)
MLLEQCVSLECHGVEGHDLLGLARQNLPRVVDSEELQNGVAEELQPLVVEWFVLPPLLGRVDGLHGRRGRQRLNHTRRIQQRKRQVTHTTAPPHAQPAPLVPHGRLLHPTDRCMSTAAAAAGVAGVGLFCVVRCGLRWPWWHAEPLVCLGVHGVLEVEGGEEAEGVDADARCEYEGLLDVEGLAAGLCLEDGGWGPRQLLVHGGRQRVEERIVGPLVPVV